MDENVSEPTEVDVDEIRVTLTKNDTVGIRGWLENALK